MVYWCRMIEDEPRGDAIHCEDLVALKVSIDYIRSGKSRVTDLQRFAGELLGITSPRVLYRVLERLCLRGFITLERSNKSRSCVSNDKHRITGIKPTMLGLLLSSAVSFQLTIARILKDYICKYNRMSGAETELVDHAIKSLFNEEWVGKAWGAIKCDADAVNEVSNILNGLVVLHGNVWNKNDIVITIPSLGVLLGLHQPFTTYLLKHGLYTGYVKDIARFLKPVLADLLITKGSGRRFRVKLRRSIRRAIYNQLVSAVDSNDPDKVSRGPIDNSQLNTWQYIIVLAGSLRV